MYQTFGDRLKALRKQRNLTQAALAEELGCSTIMIQRYESNAYAPSVHILTQMAVYFEISSDYLLGLTNQDGERIRQQDHFSKIKNVLSNSPIDGEEYYWVEYKPSKDGKTVEWGGQTMWIGWTEDAKCELRVLRPVKPLAAIKLCTDVFGQPMVVNDFNDLSVYLQFGGQAIINASVVKQYLPMMLEPMEVERGWEEKMLEKYDNNI